MLVLLTASGGGSDSAEAYRPDTERQNPGAIAAG